MEKVKMIEALNKELLACENMIVNTNICLSHLKPGARGVHDQRDLLDYYKSKRRNLLKKIVRMGGEI